MNYEQKYKEALEKVKEHSRVENELNSKGVLLEEYYNSSMDIFYKNLFRYN